MDLPSRPHPHPSLGLDRRGLVQEPLTFLTFYSNSISITEANGVLWKWFLCLACTLCSVNICRMSKQITLFIGKEREIAVSQA